MTARQKPQWTEARIRALGVKTDLRTAGSIFDISPGHVYERAQAGKLPFPVLRVGSRYVVPTEPIIRLLGLDGGGSRDRSQVADLACSAIGESPGTAAARPAPPDRAAI